MAIETYEQVGEFVEMLVTQLVDNPDAVSVEAIEQSGREVCVEVSADPADIGKIIGRSGRTIKSIRTLARAAASDAGFRVEVEIVEEDE
jgi:uncharacterized protein